MEHLAPPAAGRTVSRLLIAKGLRGFGDGFVSLLLPLYLLALGFTPMQVGLVATTTLFGSGVLTLLVGLHAWRFRLRSLLLGATVLMAATGIGFVLLRDFWPLMLLALVGTLNPSGGDVSVFLPLEHAVLTQAVSNQKRTAVFARYSLVGTLLGAFGALAAGVPALIATDTGLDALRAMQAMFVLYALLGIAAAAVYRGLPNAPPTAVQQRHAALGVSKRRVYALAALFSLDAFGGGFLVQSLLALWLYQRFGLSVTSTAVFARYSLVGTLLGAFGALAAGVPALIAADTGLDALRAMQAMFVLYALLGIAAAAVYRGLPNAPPTAVQQRHAALGVSKRRVYALAALFSLDAFGGGFLVQSLLALWLYQRFGLSVTSTAAIFFWTGVLTAFSYLVATRIADRIGLVKTMVFTHLPSSVCLILIPFMPEAGYAVALLFVRSALSQMDVPTRSSYVMAIVSPAERPAAASITSVPRSLASAASPVLAGWMLSVSAFGWPLIVGGVVKIVYDLLLLGMFSKVHPPEESKPGDVAPGAGPAPSTPPTRRLS